MKRTLVTVVLTMSVVLAIPSFAASSQPGATPAAASANSDLKVVTGEVVMASTDYLIVATRTGLQRFWITPESKINGPHEEGDEVMITYRVVNAPAGSKVAAKGARATATVAQVETASAASGRSAGTSAR